MLTVTAKGYAPELSQFIMGAEKHDVSIQLQPSTPLVGRIVDADGKAVPNAWVYVDTWRGFRSLEQRIRADRNGKFTWVDAPSDTVLCDVDATQSGFIRQRLVPMTASDQEIVITVQRSSPIKGTVVDAETGEPVQSFKLIHGISFNKDQPIDWQRQQVDAGHNGKFEFTNQFPYPGYAVRIEAEGYTPAESRVFTDAEKNVVLELKLKKGAAITGTVVDADGKPVADVKVYLLIPGSNLQMNGGRVSYDQGTPNVTTTADGRYTFPPESSNFKLVATGDAGYSETLSSALSKTPELHLVAWGSLHGKLMKGSKPWPMEQIAVQTNDPGPYDAKEPRVYNQIQTTTDADGAFSIDRVVPGKAQIYRTIQRKVGQYSMGMYTDMETVEITGGKTAEVTLGGKGRPIEGRIILPPELVNSNNWIWGFNTELQTQFTPLESPLPAELKDRPMEEKQKWYIAFSKTDAGKALQAKQQEQFSKIRRYALEINPDGTFRVEDVVPGKYQASLNILDNSNPSDNGPYQQDVIAMGQIELTVEDTPGKTVDDPITIPDVPLTMLPRLVVGQPFPDYGAKTLDGKDFNIANYKGKYLLIDAFTESMNADTSELTALKSAAATFSSDDRFAMVGMCVYGSAEGAKKYTADNGLSWITTNVEIPPGKKSQFGFNRFPRIWLVGPDGKVIAKELKGPAISAALTTALGPQGL